MEGIEEAAEQSLKKPQDYISFGTDPSTEGFGRTIQAHRDSDLIEVSNYEVIKADIFENYPDDDSYELNDNHWAVGWIKTLCVRVYKPVMYRWVITDAFKAIYAWQEKLDNYPIADEEDYSRREWEMWEKWCELEGLTEEQQRYLQEEFLVNRSDEVTEEMMQEVRNNNDDVDE